MERGKTGSGRGSKNKIAPPLSDFIALGSKSTRDTSDSKRTINANLSKSAAGSSSTSADRKKEGSAIQSNIPLKKPKLSSAAQPPVRQISYNEAWEVNAEECDPADLVPKVLEANDNDEGDKVIGLLCGAFKVLKNQKVKPDPVVYLGLLYLIKIRPSLFSNECIFNGMASLLKRDQPQTFKNKSNPVVPVLAANLLMKGFHDKKKWPDVFIKHYIDDAIGERVWVDNEECKGFVENILTGFNTRIPPKSLLQSELSVLTPRDCASPTSIDDDDSTAKSNQLLIDQDKVDFPVVPRYAHCLESIETLVLDVVKEHLNKRQPETITRNFLKLIASACGLGDIRHIAVPKLEIWLHNPKLMRPAQELLIYICYNCTTHTQKDVEVISYLVKMRIKPKAVINLYLNGVKELINLHPENLSTILKHTIYNELSNARNLNNMPMIAVLFQTLPDTSAKLLAEIFQDLLLNKDDYSKPLRTLLREIVRVCRHDINLLSLAKTLMYERPDIVQLIPTFEFKQRMFSSIIDLLCLCQFLAISPQIKEVAMLTLRGDRKDISLLKQFQNLVSTLQHDTINWLNSQSPQIYGIEKNELLHSLHKIMILETPEHYFKPDNFLPETDRALYMRLVTNIPLLEDSLINLLKVGFSKDNGITHSEILELIDQLIQRAAVNSSDIFPMLDIKRLDIFELVFNLCSYQPPASINIPAGYVPPNLAISNLYWKGWVILLILAAHNPTTIGAIGWNRYAILRVLMEMCITNHFLYPPPTMALPEIMEQERAKEIQIEAVEKQEILQYESYLAANQISEQNSLLLPQLITMDPNGIARRPPQNILDQIQSLNSSHRLGHLLCRSRKPDFLLDIIQRQQQSSSQSMPWLAGLVQNSEGSFNQLPVQCLCEYLLSSAMQPYDKQSKQHQLLAHLQQLLTDPNQEQHAFEVLEYFLRRLSSQQSSSRLQAITGLQLVLNGIPLDDENMEIDGEGESEVWLLRKLPSIPHFPVVKSLVSTALRGACQVENNPQLVRAYITYLSIHTHDDDISELICLVNEISQLVVERNTIMAAILPHSDNNTIQARQTLNAFMSIYCNYLNKARSRREFPWLENQDLISVEWSTGEVCTMHILVVHAMIILLTYDQTDNDDLFNVLLETWFPENNEPPKAFLVDTGEEALLIPDWLKLRIIRSNIPQLVDAALKDLEPYQLVLFIQSFGVPVEAMTKLLHLLDEAVNFDLSSVNQAVLDKTYMAQLVNILHNRGASGGLLFMQTLQLKVQKLPEENILTPKCKLEQLPPSRVIQKQSVIQSTVKINVPNLINKLFIENVTINQKTDAYKNLQKILIKDTQKVGQELLGSTVDLAIQHICSILNSMQVQIFLGSLIQLSQYSCNLMRLILLPLKKSAVYTKLVDLAFNMCLSIISLFNDVKAPILLILKDFTKFHMPKTSHHKEIENLPLLTSDPVLILKNVNPSNFENTGRKLLDTYLKQHKSDVLVEAIAKVLVLNREENQVSLGTGLLIDWLASVEPELVRTSSKLQVQLLFGKINYFQPNENLHTFRAYLLTLLTHGASWATLNKCMKYLLDEYHEGHDLTAVIDFLWVLIRNPKFWQGRCEYTVKDEPENILLLSDEQLLILVRYLIDEAVSICNQQNRTIAIKRLERRLELFLCCSNKDESTMNVVKYLADEMIKSNDSFSDMSHQFLLLVYMKVPKIVCYLTAVQLKKLISKAKISDWSFSALDCMTHSLFIALSTPKQKGWNSRSRELELCARKMAAAHPILVLRQLPLIAASITGCCHVDFHQFKANHHLLLFNQVMGLLELLQPHVFDQEHKKAFEDTLENYFQCFQHFFNKDDLTPLLNRFALLLQAYVSENEQNALSFLKKHVYTLHDLKSHYLSLDSLRRLVAGIPLPREGESIDNNILMPVASNNRSPSPPLSHWSSVISTLTKLQGDDVFSALQEIDHLSSRKSAILEPIIDTIADLLISPQGNIRSLAHQLIARALKHRPNPNLSILSAFQRCLDSPRADILMSALDRLPDIVLCMQEYALPLMQKVFELGVYSNVNTIPHINKSIALLNTQKGC